MFLLVFGIPLYPYSNILIGIFPLIFAYAILKHRLLEVHVAITRATVFAIVYSLALFIPFWIYWKGSLFLAPYLGPYWWIVPMGLMAVFAFSGPHIYSFLKSKVNALVQKEEQLYQRNLQRRVKRATAVRELTGLSRLIVSAVYYSFKPDYAGLFLINNQKNQYELKRQKGPKDKEIPPDKAIADNDPLIETLKAKRAPLVYEELQMEEVFPQKQEILSQMQELSAKVIIPSFVGDNFLGFLVLGPKLSGRIYSPEDISLFNSLANQTALAIENALYVEETGKNLSLIAQEDRLRYVGKMGSSMSHQIGNRLMILDGSIQLLLESIKGKPGLEHWDKEKLQELGQDLKRCLPLILNESSKINNIIDALLDFGKVTEGAEAVSLEEIIEKVAILFSYSRKLETIDFIKEYPKNGPLLKVNTAQVKGAFLVFLNNAYEAIEEKKLQASLGRLKLPDDYKGIIRFSAVPKDKEWEIKIEDNGIGMKPEDQDSVFIPFFTTKPSSKKQGKGLGMSITKDIIEAYKGTIQVESQYGEGTAFTVTLPISKEQKKAEPDEQRRQNGIWKLT